MIPLTDDQEEKEGGKGRTAFKLTQGQRVPLDSCLEFTIRAILMQLQSVNGGNKHFFKS